MTATCREGEVFHILLSFHLVGCVVPSSLRNVAIGACFKGRMIVEITLEEERLVKDVYDIDVEEVSALADEDPYWNSAHAFVVQVWERDVSTLTAKQRTWLRRIEEDHTRAGEELA